MDLIYGPEWQRGPGPVGAADLLALYPWPEGPWLRAMMATSLDGSAVGPDGISGSISGTADQAVFSTTRRLADAVIVGAGTVRDEGYQGMRGKPEDGELRARLGKATAPRLVVVSRSLDLPWNGAAFTDSALTPLVLTCTSAPVEARQRASDRAELVDAGTDRVEPALAVAALHERGLRHIVCEGGPHWLDDLLVARLVDEADITLAPVFAGNQLSPRTGTIDPIARMRLVQVLTEDGYLMNRYLA